MIEQELTYLERVVSDKNPSARMDKRLQFVNRRIASLKESSTYQNTYGERRAAIDERINNIRKACI